MSTSGALASETLTIDTGVIPGVAIRCGYSNLGSFARVGRLLGLGKGPLSLISQAGTVASKKFSYYLLPLGSAQTICRKMSQLNFSVATVFCSSWRSIEKKRRTSRHVYRLSTYTHPKKCALLLSVIF